MGWWRGGRTLCVLAVGRAAAILRAPCQAEVYRELVDESRWSPDAYESWLGKSLREQLLFGEAAS